MHERAKSEELVVGLLCAATSVAAFVFYYRAGQVLLYGDAVAHINIARRVVDSLTPGPFQLGTVWLPFPHLLMLPFIWMDRLWQTGIAGSIPSMLAYVLGAVGVLKLGRTVASPRAGRIAALIYAANPNLLYMQSTAMTETIFLATVIWGVYFLAASGQAMNRNDEPAARASLYGCGMSFLCATLTRYDGWFIAAIACFAMLAMWKRAPAGEQRMLRPVVRNAVLLIALGPLVWLAYNVAIFGNPVEFATGPYSARAIAEQSTQKGDPPHPGHLSLKTAGAYFWKTARMNMGEGNRQWWLPSIALAGALLSLPLKGVRPAWLLWVPIPFYMLSMAYGGVPIFIPEWWPFSYYNVRYGLQLLPAFAIFGGIGCEVVLRLVQSRSAVRAVLLLIVAATAGSYASVWRHAPITLREAKTNAVTRVRFEEALAATLKNLPPDARLLMYAGNHPGALQTAGISFARVVNEGNYRIWDAALADPAQKADYVVAIAGDPVARAVAEHPQELKEVARVQTEGKPPAVIYRSSRP